MSSQQLCPRPQTGTPGPSHTFIHVTAVPLVLTPLTFNDSDSYTKPVTLVWHQLDIS